MRVSVLPTPFFGANCLVVDPGPGAVAAGSGGPPGTRAALVVDPSHGVIDQIRGVLEDAGAVVGAVLCTHGHPDHVWDAAEVSRWGAGGAAHPVPVWVPGPDVHRLEDPLWWVPMRPEGLDLEWERPDDVREIPAGAFDPVAGVRLLMVPAPGHTEGSAVFLLDSALALVEADGSTVVDGAEGTPWALTGDVIFAGSVGRTDLPGGDETQMRHTLRTLATAVDPRTALVPGHGPVTTMQRELATNPYLRRARRLG